MKAVRMEFLSADWKAASLVVYWADYSVGPMAASLVDPTALHWVGMRAVLRAEYLVVLTVGHWAASKAGLLVDLLEPHLVAELAALTGFQTAALMADR